MLDKIKELVDKVQQYQADSAENLEQFRLKFLSKKGEIGQLFDEFRTVPAEMKKQLGAEINKLKQFAQEKYDAVAAALENETVKPLVEGKTIVKKIAVPKKLVNIVVK